jgi:hypothetical protein
VGKAFLHRLRGNGPIKRKKYEDRLELAALLSMLNVILWVSTPELNFPIRVRGHYRLAFLWT